MLGFFTSKKNKKPVEVTDENFNEIIYNSELPVLLDFYATWCQPCHVMISLINRLAKEEEVQGKTVIAKVDINANPGLTKHFHIKSVPTLLFIHKNKVYERHMGLLPYMELKQKLLEFAENIEHLDLE